MVIVMKVLTFTLLLVLAPLTASAVTLQQVVALSKAGVSESVILALIDRDKTIITIDPEQLVALQRDGVSERVVLAMLKSGREEAAAADRADEEMRAANYLAAASAAPEAIVIGHGPERPNVGYYEPVYSVPPVVYGASDFNPVPFAVPYAIPIPAQARSPRRMRRPAVAPGARELCQVTGGRALPSIGFVTACPAR
jgi:hypothetical protein